MTQSARPFLPNGLLCSVWPRQGLNVLRRRASCVIWPPDSLPKESWALL